MPRKDGQFAHYRYSGKKAIRYQGRHYTLLCECNSSYAMASDLAHPSELGLPIVEKCTKCNFYPWIDFAQDTYREAVGKLLNSQRAPRRRKKDEIV